MARKASGLSAASRQIGELLKSNAGLTLLVVERGHPGGASFFGRPEVRAFLGSAHASKLVYTVPLVHNGVEAGKLLAAFADPPFSPGAARGLAQYVGQQLAPLAVPHREMKVPA